MEGLVHSSMILRKLLLASLSHLHLPPSKAKTAIISFTADAPKGINVFSVMIRFVNLAIYYYFSFTELVRGL
jgi:hypothetical protein